MRGAGEHDGCISGGGWRALARVTSPPPFGAADSMSAFSSVDMSDWEASGWHAEVRYVYECLCREVADTPLLANLTFEDFADFCWRYTPAMH